MASKKNAKANAKGALPKGFKAVSGFGESWPGTDAKEGIELQGKIIGFDEFKQPKTKTQKARIVKIAKIETRDGKTFNVWEASRLAALFLQAEGTEVYLRFDGMGIAKKKGQNAPKLFTVATK